MKKLNEWKGRKEYFELFFCERPVRLDGFKMDYDEYKNISKRYKYSNDDKSELIEKIVKDNDLTNKNIYDKIKRCLPNGLNELFTIEDSEYECLKRAFNL